MMSVAYSSRSPLSGFPADTFGRNFCLGEDENFVCEVCRIAGIKVEGGRIKFLKGEFNKEAKARSNTTNIFFYCLNNSLFQIPHCQMKCIEDRLDDMDTCEFLLSGHS